MRKNTVLVFSAFFVIIYFVFLSNWWQNSMKITFCDVGQGDAVLISLGSTQLLIDTGPDSKILQCLEHQMPFWDKKIEFLLLTHMDRDHIGGAPQVLAAFDVNYIFISSSNKKSSDFNLLEQEVSRKVSSGTRLIKVFLGQKVQVAKNLYFVVIAPQVDLPQVDSVFDQKTETILSDILRLKGNQKSEEIAENDLSIGIILSFLNVNIVFSGDLEETGELAVVKNGLLNRATLLKVGHHGSKSSSSTKFIEVVEPEVTVISSGKNNSYNHPSPQVVDLLSRLGIKIYQTAISGEMSFLSDGTKLWEAK